MHGLLLVILLSAPTADDELCAAIGKTSQIALQPRDRIYFEKNCICAAGDCAKKGSATAEQLLAKQREQAQAKKRAEAERPKQIAASEAAVLEKARAFSACSKAPDSVTCLEQANAFEAACRKHAKSFPEVALPCAIGTWEERLQK